MKRELEIEVKYNGKEYEIKIIKQSHIESEFGLSGSDRFGHKSFRLTSVRFPSADWLPNTFYARGCEKEKDDCICKTIDKEYIDELIATVKAYNEAFKDEGKPEWCGGSDDPSGCCIDWPNKNLTIDNCKNTENVASRCCCKNIKPEFLIDKDLETVKENIDSFIDELIEKLKVFKEVNLNAKSVNRLMENKKKLMLKQIRLPLDHKNCYYCMQNDFKYSRRLACDKCSYGKEHGQCLNSGSDFENITAAKNNLKEVIEKY